MLRIQTSALWNKQLPDELTVETVAEASRGHATRWPGMGLDGCGFETRMSMLPPAAKDVPHIRSEEKKSSFTIWKFFFMLLYRYSSD